MVEQWQSTFYNENYNREVVEHTMSPLGIKELKSSMNVVKNEN
jgi:hypothetical protein